MPKLLFGNAMWQLIIQTDAMSKGIMLLLLVMSIVCWSLFFYKLILLRIKNRQVREAIKQLNQVTTMQELLAFSAQQTNTLPGYLLGRQLKFLKSLLEGSQRKQVALTTADIELLQQHADQTLDEIVHTEEAYLPFLSTSAVISPLLGLFGTIWGLVHAFIRISEQQTADISIVAPGIAEALLTTLAGLMVAIPAMVMFYYLISSVRSLEHNLIQLLDVFSIVVRKQITT